MYQEIGDAFQHVGCDVQRIGGELDHIPHICGVRLHSLPPQSLRFGPRHAW